MKIGIVSTFSDKGYYEYANHFVSSLNKNLDEQVSVFLYIDGNKKLFKRNKNINIINLENAVPELTQFKSRNKNKPVKSFINDGVRFSHKSYAIWHAAMHSGVDMLVWLDADTELLKHVSAEYLKTFLPNEYFTSYLGRDSYSETGFIAFDLKNSHTKEFFDIFKNYYDSDRIYTLSAFTDCHVFDATRIELETSGKIKGHNLTPVAVKQPFNHVFDGYMIHLKGGRKDNRAKHIRKNEK
jgi:predicted peroxiredoxin